MIRCSLLSLRALTLTAGLAAFPVVGMAQSTAADRTDGGGNVILDITFAPGATITVDIDGSDNLRVTSASDGVLYTRPQNEVDRIVVVTSDGAANNTAETLDMSALSAANWTPDNGTGGSGTFGEVRGFWDPPANSGGLGGGDDVFLVGGFKLGGISMGPGADQVIFGANAADAYAGIYLNDGPDTVTINVSISTPTVNDGFDLYMGDGGDTVVLNQMPADFTSSGGDFVIHGENGTLDTIEYPSSALLNDNGDGSGTLTEAGATVNYTGVETVEVVSSLSHWNQL